MHEKVTQSQEKYYSFGKFDVCQDFSVQCAGLSNYVEENNLDRMFFLEF